MEKDRKRRDRNRPEVERREAEDACGAGDEGERETPYQRSHAAVFSGFSGFAAGFSTRSEWTLRLSARSTWNVKPSTTIDSPRLGSRPKRPTTSPPTVS